MRVFHDEFLELFRRFGLRRRLFQSGWRPSDRRRRRGGNVDQIPWEEAYADWAVPDPGIGNTTAGSGLLTDFTRDPIYILQSTATSAEIRTLPDPPKPGLIIGFTLFLKTSSNLVVRCNTPVWIGATVTQPAITQNGQFITFSSINHSIFMQSVICTKTSFTGTQSTVTNATGSRWMVLQSDGPTVT